MRRENQRLCCVWRRDSRSCAFRCLGAGPCLPKCCSTKLDNVGSPAEAHLRLHTHHHTRATTAKLEIDRCMAPPQGTRAGPAPNQDCRSQWGEIAGDTPHSVGFEREVLQSGGTNLTAAVPDVTIRGFRHTDMDGQSFCSPRSSSSPSDSTCQCCRWVREQR